MISSIFTRCPSHNIGTIFISGITRSTQINFQLIRNLNSLLYNACIKYSFKFVDNSVVFKYDIWKDGIHLLESGKAIIANNSISSINYFLGNTHPPIKELLNENTPGGNKNKLSSEPTIKLNDTMNNPQDYLLMMHLQIA